MRRRLSPFRPSFAVEEVNGEKMEGGVDLGALELARVPGDESRE